MANILLVEDNPDVAAMYAGVLGDAGHHVDCAAAAYGAVLRAAKMDYDLVIMDLLLQGANGAVASLALRGLGCTAPILVVTGGLMPIDDEVLARVSFAGRLLKPVMPSELVAEVERQLAKARIP